MIAIEHNVTGEVMVVSSTDGYDLAEWTVIDADAVDPNSVGKVWSPTTRAFVTRQKTADEDVYDEIRADAVWQALKTATPTQIDTWLTNNVTNLGEARRVLKLILLALRMVATKRNLGDL